MAETKAVMEKIEALSSKLDSLGSQFDTKLHELEEKVDQIVDQAQKRVELSTKFENEFTKQFDMVKNALNTTNSSVGPNTSQSSTPGESTGNTSRSRNENTENNTISRNRVQNNNLKKRKVATMNNIPKVQPIASPSSIIQLHQEYYHGLNGAPSLISLEKKYKTSWRCGGSSSVSKCFKRRENLMMYIEKESQKRNITVSQMIQILEKYRIDKGEPNVPKSLAWLMTNLPK